MAAEEDGLDQLHRQTFELQLIRKYLLAIVVLLVILAILLAIGVFGGVKLKT